MFEAYIYFIFKKGREREKINSCKDKQRWNVAFIKCKCMNLDLCSL